MPCACDDRTDGEWHGNDAEDFARDHLSERWVNVVQWTIGYVCPVGGGYWLRDSPLGHLQGGGPPRLRLVSEAEWEHARTEGL
jgi:hypothetical protein